MCGSSGLSGAGGGSNVCAQLPLCAHTSGAWADSIATMTMMAATVVTAQKATKVRPKVNCQRRRAWSASVSPNGLGETRLLLNEPDGVRVDLDSLNEPDGVRTTTFTDWLRHIFASRAEGIFRLAGASKGFYGTRV